MWLLVVGVTIILGFASGWAGARLALWHFNRRLRDCQYDIAAVDDRLLREVKKRAAEERWDKPVLHAEKEPDLERALGHLAIGQVDERGFLKGKEGGVYRGTK